MAQSIRSQGLSLLLACALGLGLGLLYDLLRPLRRRSRDWIWDTLFCIAAATLGFLFAMNAENGRLGTGQLFCVVLGFTLYMRCLSPMVFPIFENFVSRCALARKKVLLVLKKVPNLAKKLFQNFSV